MSNIFFNLEIEQKAKRSYQKDMENLKEARETHANELNIQEDGQDSKFMSSYWFQSYMIVHYNIAGRYIL